MCETLQLVTPGFNRSLRIESRADRLTGGLAGPWPQWGRVSLPDGAVVLREILERSGIVGWMTARMKDPRRPEDVTHDLASLIRTGVLLAAQGWRDHDDADALRHDPAFRLAASSSAGLTPLSDGGGLASQPTLSRFTALMAESAMHIARRAMGRATGTGWSLRERVLRAGARLVISGRRMVLALSLRPQRHSGRCSGPGSPPCTGPTRNCPASDGLEIRNRLGAARGHAQEMPARPRNPPKTGPAARPPRRPSPDPAQSPG